MALVGLLVWVVAVPMIIIVTLTLIGIPLAILMALGMWLAGRLGAAALVLIVGQALLKDTDSDVGVAALGALLLGVVTMVPIIGGLVGLVVSFVSIGAVAITLFGTRDEVKIV